MKNYRSVLYSEDGQSLIQFGLMFMVIVAFVALAVDVGNIYAQRRALQNAADSAALAAARELCLEHTAGEATAKAEEYLLRNGLNADEVGMSDIAISGYDVSVTARRDANTLVARMVGWEEVSVGATANSVCGGAKSACGLWPIAFDLALYREVPCDTSLLIWDADADEMDVACEIGGVAHDLCDCYDCDLNNDGDDDFEVVTGVSRGWMDFPDTRNAVYTDSCDSNGCGASELACRVANNYGGRIQLPACLPGLRGIKAGVKDEVDSRRGQVVRIPLYAGINCSSGNHCTGKDAETFYVTKFGCASVTGWVQNYELTPKPGMPKSYKKIKSHVIFATKECKSKSCMTSCGAPNGSPPEPWEVRAVGLTR